MDKDYDRNVFVNCPFDKDFASIFQALLFLIYMLELRPRVATERADSGESRLKKIIELIKSSKYSIHDLSRCESKKAKEPARMNMPFELGIDFGCREMDGQQKSILILEEQQYRYQKVLSDIAGNDIEAHGGEYQRAIRKVRNWFATLPAFSSVPPAATIVSQYEDFQEWHYETQLAAGASEDDIQDYPTAELMNSMQDWFSNGKPRT